MTPEQKALYRAVKHELKMVNAKAAEAMAKIRDQRNAIYERAKAGGLKRVLIDAGMRLDGNRELFSAAAELECIDLTTGQAAKPVSEGRHSAPRVRHTQRQVDQIAEAV